MHRLGFTRSAYHRDHLLQTPDTFVRVPLPNLSRAVAIVHASPALGAAFTQYTMEFEPGGELGYGPWQRFVYVIDGHLTIGNTNVCAGQYAYMPPGERTRVAALDAAPPILHEKTS